MPILHCRKLALREVLSMWHSRRIQVCVHGVTRPIADVCTLFYLNITEFLSEYFLITQQAGKQETTISTDIIADTEGWCTRDTSAARIAQGRIRSS
jgi:hypothetical protein